MNESFGFMLLGVTVAIVCGVLGAAAAASIRQRSRVARRIASISDVLVAEDIDVVVEATQRTQSQTAFAERLNRLYPLAGGPRTTVIGAVVGVLVGAGLHAGLNFVGVPFLVNVLITVLVSCGTAWTVGNFLEQRQREAFYTAFLVAIEDLERMVRVGISVPQAMGSIANAAADPVAPVLRKVDSDVNLGTPLGAALAIEAKRVRVSEMAMLAAIISTQSRGGGELASAVANLTEMLRERLDNRHRMKAATSEPKISLLILTVVPFIGVGVQALTQPQLIQTLLDSGRHLLGIGLGMIFTGLVVSFFIVRSVRS